MIGEFLDPIKKREAAYEYISKEEVVDWRARISFKRPPYHLFFCESWTTRREEYDESYRDTRDCSENQWHDGRTEDDCYAMFAG